MGVPLDRRSRYPYTGSIGSVECCERWKRPTVMIFSRALILQEIALVCTILISIGAGCIVLRWRAHLRVLRAMRVPLAGFALFGLCDVLVTLHGTWHAPWREANPAMRAFLFWGSWWGLCLGSALWIVAWTLVFDWLEALRECHPGRATRIGWLQLWIGYALALGHLNGFVSWTQTPSSIARLFRQFYTLWSGYAGWLGALSPFGYPLYSGLCFGAIATIIHVVIVGMHMRIARRDGHPF